MKKGYKWMLRSLLGILALHVVLSVLLSAAFVAISMGEFGQPRFLEHNGCLGGDIEVWFCLMGQTVPDMMFGGTEILLGNVIRMLLLEMFA